MHFPGAFTAERGGMGNGKGTTVRSVVNRSKGLTGERREEGSQSFGRSTLVATRSDIKTTFQPPPPVLRARDHRPLRDTCVYEIDGGRKRGDYEVMTAELRLSVFQKRSPSPPLHYYSISSFLRASFPPFRNIQFLEEVYGVVSVGKLPVIY